MAIFHTKGEMYEDSYFYEKNLAGCRDRSSLLRSRPSLPRHRVKTPTPSHLPVRRVSSFNYITDSGDVIGFDVDVAQEIADRLGKTMEYKTTAWDGIVEGLRAKRYDAILGSMGITPEREERVGLLDPLLLQRTSADRSQGQFDQGPL